MTWLLARHHIIPTTYLLRDRVEFRHALTPKEELGHWALSISASTTVILCKEPLHLQHGSVCVDCFVYIDAGSTTTEGFLSFWFSNADILLKS